MKKITRCTTSDILKSIKFLLALSAAMGATSAQAATDTWNGATTAWTTGSNWSLSAAPGTTDVATFNSVTYTAQPQITTNTPQSVLGVQFGDGSTAAGALTLSAASFATANQKTSGVTASNSSTITIVNSTGTVVGDLVTATGIPAGTTVTAIAGNVLTLSQPTSASIATGAQLTFIPTLTVGASGITASAGLAGVQTISAPVIVGTSQTWTNNATLANALTVSGNTILGANTLTFSGAANSTTNVSGVINGTGAVVIDTAGAVTASGANTFTGGLTVKNGTFVAGVSNATTVSGAAGPSTSAITLGGGGSASLLANSFTVSNAINLGSTTGTLTVGNNGTTTAAVFSGAIALGGRDLTLAATGTTGTLTVSGGITGTGNLTINDNSSGAISLSTNPINNIGTITNNGTGSGTVTIATVGTNVTGVVQNSGTSPLIVTSLASIGTGLSSGGAALFTVTNQLTGTGALALNANSTGGITLTGGTNHVGTLSNTGSGSGTVTVGAIGSNVTGITQNSATSTLLLSGANTNYNGTTNLTVGTLKIGSATALGGNGSATGTGSALNIAAGTTLDASVGTNITTVNQQNWNGDFTFAGTANLGTGTGAVSLGSGAGTARTVTTTAGILTVGGVVSNGATANSLIKAGAGTLTLTGANTFTGSVTVQGGGSLALNNANAYAGTTTILNGNLSVGNANALGTGNTTAVLLGDTAVVANNSKLTMAMLTGGTLARNIIVQAGNTGTATIGETASSVNNTLTGTITLGTGTVGHGVTLSNNGFADLQFSGKISDPTVGGTTSPGLVSLAGANGTSSSAGHLFIYNTTNDYAGGTLLTSGRLGFNGTGTFLGSGPFVINVGTITGGNTGGGFSVTNNSSLTGISNMVWNSDFIYENNATGAGSLNLGTSAVTLGNGSQVAGATRTLYVNASGVALTVGGAISDSTSGSTVNSLTKAGAGFLILSGASTYTGATTLASGKVQLSGGDDRLPTGTILTVNAGTVANTAGARLDLNTRSQTVGGLSSPSDVGAQATITNASTGASVLTVNNATNTQFDGLLLGGVNTGTLALTKSNTGTLTLTGSHNYTGGTTVSGGTLIATGAVTTNAAPTGVTGTNTTGVGSGVITLTSTAGLVVGEKISGSASIPAGTYITAINGSVVSLSNFLTNTITAGTAMTFGGYNGSALGSGNVTVASGATLQLGDGTNNAGLSTGQTITSAGTVAFKNNGTSQTISNVISGASAVNHLAGNVTLSGNNTYTGVTTISNGAALSLVSSTVNSTIGSSSKIIVGETGAATLDVSGISTAGGFQLKSGQTLAGHGTVVGNTTTLSGSVLSPGNSPGTTTFNGALTLNSGTSLVFDLASVGASDEVAVTGLLTLNNQDFTNFTFSTLPGFGAGTYILFDASSTIAGSLGLGLTSTQFAGYNATLSIDSLNNDLILTVAVVPEPGTWAMMLGGLGLLVAIQRRRSKLGQE